MSDIDVELTNINVTTEGSSLPIDATTSVVEPCIVERESLVEGYKKEYSIVGDGLYASVNAGEAPQWLTSIIDAVISSQLDNGLADVREARLAIIEAINEIDLAKNNYAEAIDIIANIDEVIVSKVEQAKVELNDNIAKATEVVSTYVTEEYAGVLAGNVIDASLNSGAINARLSTLEQVFVTDNSANASSIDALSSVITDPTTGLEATAAATQSLYTYTGYTLDGSSTGTGLLADVEILQKQNDGIIETTTGTYNVILNRMLDDGNPDDDELLTSAQPYAGWVAAEQAGDDSVRAAHVGDVYVKYNLNTNGTKEYIASYKFIKTIPDETSPLSTDTEGYTWAVIVDQAAQDAYVAALNAYDLADGKRRVFTTTPVAPYDKGDLWIDDSGTYKVIKSWDGSTWKVADEQTAEFADEINPKVNTLKNQIDGKIEYFYYSNPTANPLATVSAGWGEAEHGNVVYYKDTDQGYWYNSSLSTFEQLTDTSILRALREAEDAQATADGKITTFYGPVTVGTTGYKSGEAVGDLLIASDDNNKMYRWNGSAWGSVQDKAIVAVAEDVTVLTTDVKVIDGALRADSVYNFASGLSFWSPSRYGDPANISTLTGTTSIDSALGVVYNWFPTAGGNNVTQKRVYPAKESAVYKIKSRFKITSLPSDGVCILNHIVIGLNSTYSHVSTLFASNTSYNALGVYEMEHIISIDGSGVDHAWPAGSTYLRFGIRLASNETGLRVDISSVEVEDITQATIVAGSVSTLENTLNTKIDNDVASVESKFAYNSALTLNGTTYNSGFGLATSLTAGSGIPVGSSEFWIQADTFRVKDTSGNDSISWNGNDLTVKGNVLSEKTFIPRALNDIIPDSVLPESNKQPDWLAGATRGQTYRIDLGALAYSITGDPVASARYIEQVDITGSARDRVGFAFRPVGSDAYVYIGRSTSDYFLNSPTGKYTVRFSAKLAESDTQTSADCQVYLKNSSGTHSGKSFTVTPVTSEYAFEFSMGTGAGENCILRFDVDSGTTGVIFNNIYVEPLHSLSFPEQGFYLGAYGGNSSFFVGKYAKDHLLFDGNKLTVEGNIKGSSIVGSSFKTSEDSNTFRTVISGKSDSIELRDDTDHAYLILGKREADPWYDFSPEKGIINIDLKHDTGIRPIGVCVENPEGMIGLGGSFSGFTCGCYGYGGVGTFDENLEITYGGKFSSYNASYIEGVDDITIAVDADASFASISYGVRARGSDYDFYSVSAGAGFGPFTGSHDCLVSDYVQCEVGDVISDYAFQEARGISNTLFRVRLSSGSDRPIGVMCSERRHKNMDVLAATGVSSEIPEDYSLTTFNAVGEGQVNVIGEGGDFSNGDLITVSSTPGKGMRQNKEDGTPDDVIRNITVAKVRGNWSFESADEIKMVPCIYLCG